MAQRRREGQTMSDDPHADGGPPTWTADGAHPPTHAERTRTLVAGEADGVLSTVGLDPAGHPFGSVVTYALDDDGRPLVLMSTMAVHTQHLDLDPRASLLVTAGGEGTGRLAAARATLVGTLTAVPEPEHQAALARYRQAHPDAFWADFPDFGVRRLAVERVRYVRGFGEMSWVDGAAYAAARPDPVAAAEGGIVEHMNDDHADALREIVAAELDVDGTVTAVTMLSCDGLGFEVRILREGDAQPVGFGRIGFDQPVEDVASTREAMVALVRRARAA